MAREDEARLFRFTLLASAVGLQLELSWLRSLAVAVRYVRGPGSCQVSLSRLVLPEWRVRTKRGSFGLRCWRARLGCSLSCRGCAPSRSRFGMSGYPGS